VTQKPPHFLPYQGSKRLLAPRILATVQGRRFARVIEPFAGSGAVTLAAAHADLADRYLLGESLKPLADLWSQVLSEPEVVAARYAELWQDPHGFGEVRQAYNQTHEPAALLYLLARCVKNAPRWSQTGAFNQAPDQRRRGVQPERLAGQLRAVSRLLHGRCEVQALDFAQVLRQAGPEDLVYLDPPWQGTSLGRDRRYHAGLTRERLVQVLAELRARRVPFLLSYDGRCGEREYAQPLPDSLGLTRRDLDAGRSSQATLAGRAEVTVESLYVSPELLDSRQ
jgi:DNA adenine methylase